MKQSVPWSVKGVGSDARETAKELARRSGMTLGQWLNAMIAEQTEETARDSQGFGESDLRTADASISERLGSMHRRASETASVRHLAPDIAIAGSLLRDNEERTATILERLVAHATESETRTAQLIEGLARQNHNTEVKTAKALGAVAKWIEAAERSPRRTAGLADTGGTDIRAVMARLDQIEERLPANAAAAQPFRATIEKLEGRLAALAGRGAGADELNDTAADLERRLAEVAAAMATTDPSSHPSTSPWARADGGASLGEAIEQIGARQRALEDTPGRRIPTWPPQPRGAVEQAPPEPTEDRAALGLQAQIAGLTHEISALRQAGKPSDLSADPAIRELRADIQALGRAIATLPRTDDRPALAERLDALGGMIDDIRTAGTGDAATRAMERHLSEIARAIADAKPKNPVALDEELKGIAVRLDRLATGRPDGRDSAIADVRADIAALGRSIDAMGPGNVDALGMRIDALADRVDTMKQSPPADALVKAVEHQLSEVTRALTGLATRELGGITTDLKAISAKLDEAASRRPEPAMPAPAATMRAGEAARDTGLAELRADIAALARNLAPSAGSRPETGAIERRIDALSERIDELRQAGVKPASLGAIEHHLAQITRDLTAIGSQDVSALSEEVRALSAKLDLVAAQPPRDPAGVQPASLGAIERHLAQITRDLSSIGTPDLSDLSEEVRSLSSKLDIVAAQGIDAGSIVRLQKQADEIRELAALAGRTDAFDVLGERLDDLVNRIDAVHDGVSQSSVPIATASLEAMIRQLVDKLEMAQRPGADERSLDALEKQIARITDRLDATPAGTPGLGTIERSLNDLFIHLEETRHAAVAAADGAASRAVREALDQFPRTSALEPVSEDVRRRLDDIRSHQDESGRKTQLTLEAVQETLERLASRMSSERGEPAPASSFMAATAMAATPVAPDAGRSEAERSDLTTPLGGLGGDAENRLLQDVLSRDARRPSPSTSAMQTDLSGDVPLEPGTGGPTGRKGIPALDLSPPKPASTLSGGGDPRASFIAAARRAAQAAAAEAAVAPGQMPDSRSAEQKLAVDADAAPGRMSAADMPAAVAAPRRAAGSGTAPAGRVRSVYERRKRPILLGIAALVVALGTLQVAKVVLPSGDATPAPQAVAPRSSESGTPGGGPGGLPAANPPGPQSSLLAPATQPVAALEPPPARPAPAATASLARPGGVPSFEAAMTGSAEPDMTGALQAGPDPLAEAVRAGEPRGLYDMAGRLADIDNPRRDLPAAADLYQKAAAKGFAPAQYRLGSMYEKGLGVGKDLALARTWYERAADKGNVKAMHNMAVLFAEGGIEGKPDYATASQWFRLAAEHGLRDSEYNYGILLTRGLGSSADLVEAYKWFDLAAAQGDQDAAGKRDEVAARLDPAGLATAKAAVARFQARQAPIMANDTTLPSVAWDNPKKGGA